jgi:hypothetical protein
VSDTLNDNGEEMVYSRQNCSGQPAAEWSPTHDYHGELCAGPVSFTQTKQLSKSDMAVPVVDL